MIQSPRVRMPGEPRSLASASREQAIPATQTTRSRHKRRTLSVKQTFCFNVPIFAFNGVFAKPHYSAREQFSPAPTFTLSRGGQGTPVGAASLRQQILRRACEAEPSSERTFPSSFRSFGKRTPARGAQKKKLLQINRRTWNVQFNLSPSRGAHNKIIADKP